MIEFKDEIYTNTDCYFSFIDRIRILFRGFASVRVVTKTENLPGEVLSTSSVLVSRIFRFKKADGGYEAKFNKSLERIAGTVARCGPENTSEVERP
uniref:Uncharacterized protein n=1 Tax=viral metagenome TaxID=1070528 RepID=A0A6M3JR68_9ZZZZ